MIGGWLEPLLRPVGFNWQIAVSLVPAMAAREVVVASLATVYAVGASDSALAAALHQDWSLATAVALLAWFVFAPHCLPTLAVIRRETGSRKWSWFAIAYLFALAYIGAFVAYRVALALGWG